MGTVRGPGRIIRTGMFIRGDRNIRAEKSKLRSAVYLSTPFLILKFNKFLNVVDPGRGWQVGPHAACAVSDYILSSVFICNELSYSKQLTVWSVSRNQFAV
jgi:hypothetical protein